MQSDIKDCLVTLIEAIEEYRKWVDRMDIRVDDFKLKGAISKAKSQLELLRS